MNDTIIIENFLPQSYQDEIEHELLGSDYFPWFFNPSTVDSSKTYQYAGIGSLANAVDTPQFYHLMVNTETGIQPSGYYNLVRYVLYFLENKTDIKVKEIVRIKSNLLLPYKGDQGGVHHPHIDLELKNSKTLIYYVKDSDGDTITYNEYFDGTKQSNFTIEKSITPKKGTAVLLDTNRFHSSSLPRSSEFRCVINFVFKI